MGEELGVILVVVLSAVVVIALAAGAALVIRDTLRGRGRWGVNLQPVHCPKCGQRAPGIRRPKNRQQALWGGCTCEQCGAEYDKWGQSVDDAFR